MKKLHTFTLVALLAFVPTFGASNIGVVDFRKAIEDSKVGKQEQNSLEALRKQLSSGVEGVEKELSDLMRKLRDPDYLDSLSPDAEEQMKMRYQQLMQEMQQQQQQAYQIMSQAEYRFVNEMTVEVQRAAKVIAGKKHLELVVREDGVFYYEPDMDITREVIAEMDKAHKAGGKGNGTNARKDR